jgi:AcrR family transcriptional regulator
MTALPRRQQNRLNRERAILDAALKVFAATGYSGATMDAVAAEAGVTKPTLYSYFPSKESLFQAMMLGKRDLMLDVFEHPLPQGMVADLVAFAWDLCRYGDAPRDAVAGPPDHRRGAAVSRKSAAPIRPAAPTTCCAGSCAIWTASAPEGGWTSTTPNWRRRTCGA